MREDTAPGVTGIHHISLTVSDIEASAAWYQRLLGADRLPMKFDNFEREETGYGVLLVDQRSGLVIGLHTNTGNDGDPFNEARCGLDHVGFNVATREDLEAWAAWLDELGIEHSGIRDGDEPFAFATLVIPRP
jgi:catechol 2,3-dioxygenase-like lactoylglutathione lyase family enzyme